jgi:hypothetical protein
VQTEVAQLPGAKREAVVLHLQCPIGTVDHLAVFHVLPWLAVVVPVQLVRRWVSTKRFAP